MNNRIALLLAAAALAVSPAGALAQTAAPSAEPAASSAPAAAPSTTAPATGGAPPAGSRSAGGTRAAAAQIKKIPAGSLSFSDLRYGLTHPVQEADKVRKMKSISFDKLRVYKLSGALKSTLKVSDANADIPVLAVLGPGVLVAQTSPVTGSNGSNSPIAVLQYVLANINVSNALNNVNVLNNSNVNVGVSLQDVLNGNKISIGQVAGIFVNGLGIITTITK